MKLVLHQSMPVFWGAILVCTVMSAGMDFLGYTPFSLAYLYFGVGIVSLGSGRRGCLCTYTYQM